MLTETENKDDPRLPSKRKLDPLPKSEENEEENQPNKSLKHQPHTHNDIVSPNKENSTPSINSSSNTSIEKEKRVDKAEAEKNVAGVDNEEEDDDDADFEDEEEREENGKAASVDRKGKGIMIEEDEDDSDDNDESDNDSDDSSDGMDGSDELEDDPLAEVDLDNILPSRTRRRGANPGVCIGKNECDDSDA